MHELCKLDQVYVAVRRIVVPLQHRARPWCTQVDAIVSQDRVQLAPVDEAALVGVKEVERLYHARRHAHALGRGRLARQRLPSAALPVMHFERAARLTRLTAAAQQRGDQGHEPQR
jgi:hypothetical protein